MRTERILGLIEVFVGVGAISGGAPMLIHPNGSTQGLSTVILANSPFSSFLIPGILLTSIIGLGNLAGAWLSWNDKKYTGEGGIVLGAGLIIWITVQTFMLGLASTMQPLFFVIGISQLILGIRIYRKQKFLGY